VANPGSFILQVVNVSKSYQAGRTSTTVLRDASLTIAAGEIVAIQGPSGSGKSTLLSLIAGLEYPDSGHVYQDNILLGQVGAKGVLEHRLRTIGIVTQRANLLTDLTVLENVLIPLRLLRIRGEGLVAQGLAALADLQLEHRADALPSTLSAGETQRAAFARATINRPKLILADEPTANLDRESARNLMALLVKRCQQLDCAALLTTHDPFVATQCSRVLQLSDGQLRHS
jgi:ABC-type lipoprotein export system ATPase subunit